MKVKIAYGIFLAICLSATTYLVFLLVTTESYADKQQRKQNECIASGGIYIDNKYTDSHCYKR